MWPDVNAKLRARFDTPSSSLQGKRINDPQEERRHCDRQKDFGPWKAQQQLIGKSPQHEKDRCHPANDKLHVSTWEMCTRQKHWYDKACCEEQLSEPFLRHELALDIFITKVNSCQNRLVQQYMQAGGLQYGLEANDDEERGVTLTMYVCTTKKKSSSTGTEKTVGPRTASAG